jgi:hypothetical protein
VLTIAQVLDLADRMAARRFRVLILLICDSGWFERHIGEHIRTVLRLGSASIDPKTPLRALGFDAARMGTSR